MKSKTILLVTSYCLVLTLTGCDAFVRKFTRKPKTQEFPEGEMILAPVEYEPIAMSSRQRYQQDFLFGKPGRMSLSFLYRKKGARKNNWTVLSKR